MDSQAWTNLTCIVQDKEMQVSLKTDYITYLRQWREKDHIDFSCSSLSIRGSKRPLKVAHSLDDLRGLLPSFLLIELSGSGERALINPSSITYYREFLNPRKAGKLFIIYFPSFVGDEECYFITPDDPKSSGVS